MMTVTWQQRRSAFNHDWLKNRFLPALAKWLNLLDDLIEDTTTEASFVASVLPQWEGHRDEALALARDFEVEMSPARLFDCIKWLRRRGNEVWLRQLVHRLWLARYPVQDWVADASARAARADAAYERLQVGIRQCAEASSAAGLRHLRPQFVEFRDCCQSLAQAVGSFPSEVRVV
jgi:uncharacterized protein with PIN domain